MRGTLRQSYSLRGRRLNAAAWEECDPLGMFERFTERARQVVVLAQEEARALEHNYIGTEHILLGLLREEEGLAARVLDSLEVTAERTRAQVVRIVGSGEEVTAGQIPFTPRAKKVLELALREALSLGHNYIGTEHILLGLVRENEGVAARVLLDFDADAQKIRNEVVRMLSGPDYRVGGTGRDLVRGFDEGIRVVQTARVRQLLMTAAARALDDGRSEIRVRDVLHAIAGDEKTAPWLADVGLDLLIAELEPEEAGLREAIERHRARRKPPEASAED